MKPYLHTLISLMSLIGAVVSDCPFQRFEPSGLACHTEVDETRPFVEQLVEKLHLNDLAAEWMPSHMPDQVECDELKPYRSISGYCNNLLNSSAGGAMSLYKRKLPNAYADGKMTPRSMGLNGNRLPSPRLVSTTVSWYLPLFDPTLPGLAHDHLLVLTEFGQWLGHDLVYTPTAPAVEECQNCDSENSTHPDCFPIRDAEGDCEYNFTRSANGNLDSNGVREQINRVTSYLDGSTIYGSDTATAKMLREVTGGRLTTQDDGNVLPQMAPNPDFGCSPNSNETCFLAGDDRASQNYGLYAMHLLWVKEHNRIADFFAANSHWNDEQIYLRTRQLITAMIQRITYNEYLPVLLGEAIMEKFGLKEEEGSGFFDGYQACDVTPFTEFATAAYRFGHSMIFYRHLYQHDPFEGATQTLVHLDNNWFNTKGFKDAQMKASDAAITALNNGKPEKRDKHFQIEVRDEMMRSSPRAIFKGLDLNAFNIQRGRDHGLPGYNAYRQAYGLEKLTSMDDIYNSGIANRNTTESLKLVYDYVDDIDLYIGIILENVNSSARFGILGDVGAHIIAEHFQKLKRCDRFFYSGKSPAHRPFNQYQLAEIRKIGLNEVMCQHLEPRQVSKPPSVIGPNSFLANGEQAVFPCENLLKIDLNYFLDSTYVPRSGNIHYAGCYDTLLQFQQMGNHYLSSTVEIWPRIADLTPANCLAACESMNYTYAGTEYGVQCFCGHYVDIQGVPGATGCNFQCPGDSNSVCGAGWRISVYTRGDVQHIGCFETLSGNHRLPHGEIFPRIPALAPEKCLAACERLGYTYAGTEFRVQCFCGHKADIDGLNTTTGCQYPCPGDSNSICGGGWRTSVYTRAPTSNITTTKLIELPDKSNVLRQQDGGLMRMVKNLEACDRLCQDEPECLQFTFLPSSLLFMPFPSLLSHACMLFNGTADPDPHWNGWSSGTVNRIQLPITPDANPSVKQRGIKEDCIFRNKIGVPFLHKT